MATVTDLRIAKQSGTTNTMFATWKWDKQHTDHYSVVWYYATGDGVWFIGSETTATAKQSLYNYPDNAKKVKFKVKPVAKTHKVNGKDVKYWTASWHVGEYEFKYDAPSAPSVPTVAIDKYTLTAELDSYDTNIMSVEFEVVKNHQSRFASGIAAVTRNHASFSWVVDAGGEYKVRCRSVGKNKIYSSWTEYSDSVSTIPTGIRLITVCRALSETSVELEWTPVTNATGYDVEYTTNLIYFDSSNEVSSMSVQAPNCRAIVTGLDSGEVWFFRVRATNGQGESGWSSVISTLIGKAPAAPTTWSSTTTATVGEKVTLYWVHNSEDGSSQRAAEVEYTEGGVTKVIPVENMTNDAESDRIYGISIPTDNYTEGASVQWRVRTKGIVNEYGPWSIQRKFDVFAPPVLEFSISNTPNGVWTDTITSFPFYISATAKPDTQSAVSFYLSISANESYQTVDSVGKTVWISAGDEVYSKQVDVSTNRLSLTLTPADVDLENTIEYTATCLVSMNSGLTATTSGVFRVSWTEAMYEPDAEIGVDMETLTAYIRPYCEIEEELVENVSLSVFRREFDGGFTELATGLQNTSMTTITDPHPALDYARYRIVATSNTTGSMGFYDIPAYPIGEKAIVIQWAEEWSDFRGENEDELETPTWTGSLLKLPYNIDVSDSYSPDAENIKYIGRNHPVSYYGTQIGETATWSVEIPKNDAETLYTIRRLAAWMGDVYVREPSGSGYWAQITVSFSQKHCEVTLPVTFNITRVDGGI